MANTTTISGLPDAPGPLHGAERLPLDDLVAGATRDASTLQIAQTLPDATTTSRGAMTAAQALKLAGIATGATVNATDAALRDRATHTGEQAIGTITGLSNALASKVSSVGLDTPAGQGLSVSNSPVNSSGTLVISVASGYQIPTAAQLASFLTSATAVTTYQPLDSDLTAIAALSTTSFGRGLLALADAAAGRTTLGLGTSSTPQFAGLGLTGGNLTARQSATQDAIIVSGRSGGNGSFSVTFIPATLTASQTLTAPNVSGTIVTTGDTGTVTSAMIANGTIVNDDISASAAIADGKLGTISTAGKVSNSATTATSANTPSAIVARDGSGNFTANVITASLTGNVTGNVTGNLTGTASAIADGTVTSDKIVNGTIVDADISNSAEIAVSKLADGSARQLLQTDAAGTGVEWTSNVDIPGTLDVTGTATFDSIASHPLGALGTPSITFTNDLNTGIWSPGADQLAFATAGNECARIDSSGRLLIGASTNYLIGDSSGWTLQASNSAGISNLRTGDNSAPSYLVLAKTRATSAGSFARLENNDIIGDISFVADDGTDYATNAAKIRCQVDGTPGADDMPGRLVFFTTVDGASSPTEALRITNDKVIAYNQAAPVSKSTAATLTIAELKGGIIQYTGNAQTLTLPTGTLSEGGFSGLYSNMTFEWSVINTGSGTCTVAGDTGHTVVGAGAVAAGSSGRFASRRTGANTFVTYRLS